MKVTKGTPKQNKEVKAAVPQVAQFEEIDQSTQICDVCCETIYGGDTYHKAGNLCICGNCIGNIAAVLDAIGVKHNIDS